MAVGHVFLIGFMGAGKSTVACLVAEHRGQPCVDLDDEIESVSGRTIAQLFAEQGEDVFRDMESAALERLEACEPSVVACGGGIVVRAGNRAALKRSGIVIYLAVSAEEALARVGNGATRPLLAGPGGTIAATQLLAARESLYRSVADATVDTVGRSRAEVARDVVAALEGAGR